MIIIQILICGQIFFQKISAPNKSFFLSGIRGGPKKKTKKNNYKPRNLHTSSQYMFSTVQSQQGALSSDWPPQEVENIICSFGTVVAMDTSDSAWSTWAPAGGGNKHSECLQGIKGCSPLNRTQMWSAARPRRKHMHVPWWKTPNTTLYLYLFMDLFHRKYSDPVKVLAPFAVLYYSVFIIKKYKLEYFNLLVHQWETILHTLYYCAISKVLHHII